MKAASAWFALVFTLTAGRAQEKPSRPLAALFPADSIVYIEAPEPANLWNSLRSTNLIEQVQRLESVRAVMREGAALAVAFVLAQARNLLGSDFDSAVPSLAGGGVAVSLSFGEAKQPRVLLVMRARDAEQLVKTRDAFAESKGVFSMGEWLEDSAQVTSETTAAFGKVDVISTGKTLHHAIAGNLLFLSNDRSAIARALKSAPGAGSLEDNANYKNARKSCPGAAVFAFADVDAVAAAKGIRNEEVLADPGQALLFGGMKQAVVDSPWLAGRADVDGSSLRFSVRTAAKPAKATKTFLTSARPIPDVAIPRRIGSVTFRRDVAAFWNDHEGIVAPEFDADFAKFNSFAAAILGVKRMDEDVFEKLEPISQWFVAGQTYAGLPAAPKIKIPAFGVILRAKEPNKKLMDGFRRAFTTAMAVGAADQAQKEMMTLGLSDETVGDIKISYAAFPEPEGVGSPAQEYNYSPAFFTFEEYVVSSSTLELARDLAKALPAAAASARAAEAANDKNTAPHPRTLDSVEVRGAELCRALRENWDPLIAQSVLTKGKTKAQATRELGFVIDLLSLVSSSELSTAEDSAGLRLDWRVGLAPAAPAQSKPRSAVR
jgi:hypothetical protein